MDESMNDNPNREFPEIPDRKKINSKNSHNRRVDFPLITRTNNGSINNHINFN